LLHRRLSKITLVTLGRAVAIYPCCLLFARSLHRVTWKHPSILFWGGLRGALALALALGLPPEVTQRDMIITISLPWLPFQFLCKA